MDKQLIEKYKDELMKMYRSVATIPTISTNNEITKPQQDFYSDYPILEDNFSSETGKLSVFITSFSEFYPVKGAKVTVFTGDYKNPTVISYSTTDESGKTEDFILAAPPKSLSLDSSNTAPSYSLYNMLVEADGYVDNVHLNIPVFTDVTSIQRSNLVFISAAAGNEGPFIYNENSIYNL